METTHVVTRFVMPGYHCWPGAPQHLEFLSHPHFHNFHVAVTVTVKGGNREVEFFELEQECRDFLKDMGCESYMSVTSFGTWSCEHIAQALFSLLKIAGYQVESVEISEDGTHSAIVRRDIWSTPPDQVLQTLQTT